jgi:hypothetical protein
MELMETVKDLDGPKPTFEGGFKLLDKEAYRILQLITDTARQLWGWDKALSFGEMVARKSPYPEFEWEIKLHEKMAVKLLYDRSALEIRVEKNGEYVPLGEYSANPVAQGHALTDPDNLMKAFKLLDEIAGQNAN